MKNAKMIGFGLYTPKNLVENERLQAVSYTHLRAHETAN